MENSFFFFLGASCFAFFYFVSIFSLKEFKKNIAKTLFLSLFGVMFSKVLFLITMNKTNQDWTFNGGFVFYGFLFPYLLYFLFKKNNSYNNCWPIALCFAHSIGRLGCFFSGCCYGEMLYVSVSLIEASFLLLLGTLLIKMRNSYDALPIFYIFLYSNFRFFIEFCREDDIRGKMGVLSTSQWISIFLIFASVSIILKQFFGHKTQVRRAPT